MEAILAKRLKAWQKDFRKQHSREPRRSDIAKVPDIAAIYDTWTAMGAAQKAGPSRSKEKGSDKVRGRSKDSAGRARESVQGSVAGSSPSSQTHRTSGTGTSTMPPPSTPTKSQRAGINPFRTPSKGSPLACATTTVLPHGSPTGPSRYPQTPTSSNRHSDDLFKTPTRPASHHKRGPATPMSAVKLRTPPVASPAHASRDPNKRQMDASFHFNTSPSSFRDLVGRHSHVASPNSRSATAGAKRRQDEEALLSTVYTPRTKARKRLRGEEVPPTPQQDFSAGAAGAMDLQDDQVLASPTLNGRSGLPSLQASPSKARSSRLKDADNDAEYQRLRPGPSAAATISAARPTAATKKRAGGMGRSLSAFWGADFERKDGPSSSSQGASSKQAKGDGPFRRATTLATASAITQPEQNRELLSPSAAKLAALRRRSKEAVGQLTLGDDDDDEVDGETLGASPQKPRRKPAFTSPHRTLQQPATPTISRRGPHGARKFRSLFDEDEQESDGGSPHADGAAGDLDLDAAIGHSYEVDLDEAADADLERELGLEAAQSMATKTSKPTRQPDTLAALPPSTLLLDDFSSDSDSDETEGKKQSAPKHRRKANTKGKDVSSSESNGAASSSRASQSPSKAIYLRAYRRFGALTLDHGGRTTSSDVIEDVGNQGAGQDSRPYLDQGEDNAVAEDEDADDLFRRLSTARHRAGSRGPPTATVTSADEPAPDPAPSSSSAGATTSPPAPFALNAYTDSLSSLGVNPSSRTRAHALSSRRRALAGLLAGADAQSSTRSASATAVNAGSAVHADADADLVAEVEREMEEQAQAQASLLQGGQEQRGPPWQSQSQSRSGGQGQGRGQKQTWGGAKAANRRDQNQGKDGAFLLGKARRGLGMAGAVGTLVLSDEEGEEGESGHGQAKNNGKGKGRENPRRKGAAQSSKGTTVFRRVGRSGVDDDEESEEDDAQLTLLRDDGDSDGYGDGEGEGEGDFSYASAAAVRPPTLRVPKRHTARVRAQDADEDWASDVDEDEWGWDGADMEDVDVL